MIQKLRCTGIAHLRVEVDLFDLKATAMAPGLDDHIDEHSQKSADIIAREIAAALGFLDEQCQLLEGARRRASMDGGDRPRVPRVDVAQVEEGGAVEQLLQQDPVDRKSTRLNSSH